MRLNKVKIIRAGCRWIRDTDREYYSYTYDAEIDVFLDEQTGEVYDENDREWLSDDVVLLYEHII